LVRKREAHLMERARNVRLVRPDVPAELAAVVARLLAKRPEDRYVTPAEVSLYLDPFATGARLDRLLQSDGGDPVSVASFSPNTRAVKTPHPLTWRTVPPLPYTSMPRWLPRRHWLHLAGALLLAGGLGLTVFRVSHEQPSAVAIPEAAPNKIEQRAEVNRLAKAKGEEKPLPQPWDYTTAMKKVARQFRGRPGVVLHVGDSITYASPYGQGPRFGQGKTKEDDTTLKWMHMGAEDVTDGWWLARFDQPDANGSYTALSDLYANELLRGGKRYMPPLATLLDTYTPQLIVLMLGTNDATAGRTVEAYQTDIAKAIDLLLERGIIPILSTIPPHPDRPEMAKVYNEELRRLAKFRQIPLIDYEMEILTRRPDDWNGTLLEKDDIHPTTGINETRTVSPPSADNLRNSGYLLRGWLSVKKIVEVKQTVLDRLPPPAEKAKQSIPTSAPP
jgi:hypothetical protein